MVDGLLFVPVFWLPPETHERIPGKKALLDGLRSTYDVEIFRWPHVSAPCRLEATYAASCEALAEATAGKRHVVADGFLAPTLVAITGKPIATFVGMHLIPPAATLRAAGYQESADYWLTWSRQASISDALKQRMPTTPSDEISVLAEGIEYVTDRRARERWFQAFQEVNLLREHIRINCPVLYMEVTFGSAPMAGVGGS